MEFTKPHPWKVAQFPSKNDGFCKLGCQLFYVEVPYLSKLLLLLISSGILLQLLIL